MSPSVNNCSLEIENRFSGADRELLQKALNYASSSHNGQLRKSGEEFISHPIATARRLCNKYGNVELIAAGFLHDVVEDCEGKTIDLIYDNFGDKIGFLVDAVTKDMVSFEKYPEVIIEDKIERLLWAGILDVRVLLLKLADRENNIETLKYLKTKKQVRMAFETQAIFEPLKKILSYDKPLSIFKTQLKLLNVLKRNKINSAKELKRFLLKKSFNDFNEELFDIVYRNTSNVIWRVYGMDMYKKLSTIRTFKNKIDILSVKSNGKWLCAEFKFKEGAVTKSKDLKMSVSSFMT
jgi:GTP pyrophosphokinase